MTVKTERTHEGFVLVYCDDGSFFGREGRTPYGAGALVYHRREDAVRQALCVVGTKVVACDIQDHGFSYEELRDSSEFADHIAAPCGSPN